MSLHCKARPHHLTLTHQPHPGGAGHDQTVGDHHGGDKTGKDEQGGDGEGEHQG
jgi:hypothetical protein